MILKRRHILRYLTAMEAHERVFETQLVILWREVCYHLNKVNKKAATKAERDARNRTHLCELMFVVEPRAYIGDREKELGAGTKRVVMPLGLERRTDQIGRDDVQMEVSLS